MAYRKLILASIGVQRKTLCGAHFWSEKNLSSGGSLMLLVSTGETFKTTVIPDELCLHF